MVNILRRRTNRENKTNQTTSWTQASRAFIRRLWSILTDVMAFIKLYILQVCDAELMLFSTSSEVITRNGRMLLTAARKWMKSTAAQPPPRNNHADKIEEKVKSMEDAIIEAQEHLVTKRQEDRKNKFPVGPKCARDAISMGITLCGQFKEIGTALVDLGFLEDVSEVVAEWAPLVGAGFRLLKPILVAFENAKEVSEEKTVTLSRICRLANSLTSKLRRLRKSGNTDLHKDINEIAKLLKEGATCVTKIDDRVTASRFPAIGAAKDKQRLKDWNKKADEWLKDTGLFSAIVMYHEVVNLVDVLAVRHYMTLIPILMTLVLPILIYFKINHVLKILTRSIPSWVEMIAFRVIGRPVNFFQQKAPHAVGAFRKAILNAMPHV